MRMACATVMVWMILLCALPGWSADAGTGYRLAPQDKISATVLKHVELSGAFTVPPDGMIDFPRAGRINVLGKTTAEVADALRAELGKELREPSVTVVLVEQHPIQYFILGAVAKPGQYTMGPGTRLTELIAAAGGVVGEQARLTAHLMRGKEKIPLNLQSALSGKDPAANTVLQEGDQVTVQSPTMMTVVVSGQVKNPGAVKLFDGNTLVDALAAAGDVLGRPERMRITLVRKGKVTKLAWGDATQVLLDGDAILVEQEAVARIFVNGHVKNPGAYELPENGDVLAAIALAGGVLDRAALSQVTIAYADGSTERVNLAPALNNGVVGNMPRLSGGDQVLVPESNAKITVLGMVNQPGTFFIDESKPLTVAEAIGMAGGEQKKRSELGAVAVIRTVSGKAETIPVDLESYMKRGKIDQNISLRPNDVVYVPETKKPDWSSIVDTLYKVGIIAVSAL